MILDIFAQRAATRAGRLQVELAQLKYALPRLAGSAAGRAMDRLAGGIGGRGPGETKLETDRRKIRERITRLAGRLDSIRRQRSFVRARRAKADVFVSIHADAAENRSARGSSVYVLSLRGASSQAARLAPG